MDYRVVFVKVTRKNHSPKYKWIIYKKIYKFVIYLLLNICNIYLLVTIFIIILYYPSYLLLLGRCCRPVYIWMVHWQKLPCRTNIQRTNRTKNDGWEPKIMFYELIWAIERLTLKKWKMKNKNESIVLLFVSSFFLALASNIISINNW